MSDGAFGGGGFGRGWGGGGRRQPGASGAFGQPNSQQPPGGFSPQPPAAKPLTQWAPRAGQAQSSPFGSWAPQQPAPQQSSFAGPPANVSMPQFRGRWGAPVQSRSERSYRPPSSPSTSPFGAPDASQTAPSAAGRGASQNARPVLRSGEDYDPVQAEMAARAHQREFEARQEREAEAARQREEREMNNYRVRFPGIGDAELRNAMQADKARREQQARDEFTEQYGDWVQRDELRKRRDLEASWQRDRDRFLAMRRRDQELIDAANDGGEQPVWNGNRYVLPSQSRAYSPDGRQRPGGGSAPPRPQFQGQQPQQWGGGMAQPIQQPSFGTPYDYPPGFQQPPQWGTPAPATQTPGLDMSSEEMRAKNAALRPSGNFGTYGKQYYRDSDGKVRIAW